MSSSRVLGSLSAFSFSPDGVFNKKQTESLLAKIFMLLFQGASFQATPTQPLGVGWEAFP